MLEEKIKDERGRNFVMFKPPNEVFLFREKDNYFSELQKDARGISAAQNELIPELDTSKGINGVTYPETGGQYVWHLGREYPRKGHVYPEALRDCYYPKRILINLLGFLASKDMILFFLIFGLLSKSLKGRIIGRFLDKYLDICDRVLHDHYLHPQFNTTICRELSQPIMTFLVELGVEKMRAARMSLVLITILEYDMAYRLRLEDLFTETTKEKLLANPISETRRLIKILAERDWSRPHLVEKFDRFARVLKYGFFFFRKPFRKALEPVDFSKLQFDEIDRFQVRHWKGYNWFGMTLEKRIKKWKPKPFKAFKLIRVLKKNPETGAID